MKRKLFLFTLCIPLLLGACSNRQARIEYIGAERAKALALTASGLSSDQISSFETDMSSNNGIDYYQVEFEINGEKYRYDIDALTGVIIDSRVPHTTDNKQENKQNALADTSLQPQSITISKEQGNEMLTEETARGKALEHAGLTVDQVTFIKSGLDRDDGRQVYDIEFYTNNYEEYDYNIDPYTGEVLDYDYDAEYYTPSADSGNSTQAITVDDAKVLALAQVPGATLDDIKEFETEYDDGRLEYEGKIYYNHMEYEFEIDGYSGAIRNWDVESIYD